MSNHRKWGFSLIELMVVIAIIGVLAAIAIPSYTSYTTKTNLTNAFNLMQQWQENLIINYNTSGSFPATSSFMGTSVPNNYSSSTAINSLPTVISTVEYNTLCSGSGYACTSGSVVGVWTQFLLTTNFIPGGGSYYLRSAALIDANNNVRVYCGNTNGGGNVNSNLPTAYLPSACTCINLDTVFNTGTVSNPC